MSHDQPTLDHVHEWKAVGARTYVGSIGLIQVCRVPGCWAWAASGLDTDNRVDQPTTTAETSEFGRCPRCLSYDWTYAEIDGPPLPALRCGSCDGLFAHPAIEGDR